MGRSGVCIAAILGLATACAPKNEFDILRQQNLEYLSRIDQMDVEAQKRNRAVDEYRGALASATTIIKELRQQLHDEEVEHAEAKKREAEAVRRWQEDQKRIAAYESQLSQARADLEGVRRRLSGAAGKTAVTSRPADAAAQTSAPHE